MAGQRLSSHRGRRRQLGFMGAGDEERHWRSQRDGSGLRIAEVISPGRDDRRREGLPSFESGSDLRSSTTTGSRHQEGGRPNEAVFSLSEQGVHVADGDITAPRSGRASLQILRTTLPNCLCRDRCCRNAVALADLAHFD